MGSYAVHMQCGSLGLVVRPNQIIGSEEERRGVELKRDSMVQAGYTECSLDSQHPVLRGSRYLPLPR